ncbi:hypothetical protein HK105_208916 [Polyrhizophydium stewartii]|uniref:CTLH domain-containing protein n=1 Tax=Polyrhizophydium stewartii TaxID=2732419 RepID=A0ABR4MWG7_9FUNG|nr:hypothetical protein HK105_001696 [Polyrhizophydium stewartii]
MATGAPGDDPAAEAFEATPAPDHDAVLALVYDYLVHNCYAETARSFGAACQLDPAQSRTRGGAGAVGAGAGDSADAASRMDVDDAAQPAADPEGDLAMADSSPPRRVRPPASAGVATTTLAAATTTASSSTTTTTITNTAAAATGTAASHAAGTGGLAAATAPDAPLRTLAIRRRLVQLVLEGNSTQAVALCNEAFPGLLSAGTPAATDVCFALQCQRFIECVRRSAPEALAFAQDELGKFAFMEPKYSETLQDIVALIAYTDPESSPLAGYMSRERREQVAMELNSYILAYHGASPVTALERIAQQATVVREVLHAETVKDKKQGGALGSSTAAVTPAVAGGSAAAAASSASARQRSDPAIPRWQLAAFVGS